MLSICILLIGYNAFGFIGSYDAFWHLQTGIDWIEKGLSPFADRYSFTHFGEVIRPNAYLYQALLYFFAESFGLPLGFQVFKTVFLLLPLIALFGLMYVRRSPLII